MKTIKPFENEADSFSIDDLTIENRTDRVVVYGNVDLTRDKPGLERARALKAHVDAVVTALEQAKNLPDKVEPPREPETVKNPFAQA